tara:strand:- start:16279 stop:16542 length:264 start_codon:yes stop_codon:yes gene_type:complete
VDALVDAVFFWYARSTQVSVLAAPVEESTPLAFVQGAQTPVVGKGAHEPTRRRDETLSETHLQGVTPARCCVGNRTTTFNPLNQTIC